jgi:hypothetical protein
MGGGTDINYPAQPSYGEGMAEAMKAQMEQLLGQGDYADIYKEAGFEGGNLGDILTGVEAPIRKQTAQIDTDVMRQTLLGGEQKVALDPKTGKYGIPGAEIVTSEQTGSDAPTQTAGGRYQMVMTAPQQTVNPVGHNKRSYEIPATYAVIDTSTGGMLAEGDRSLTTIAAQFKDLNDSVVAAAKEGTPEEEVKLEFEFTNPNTGKPLQEGEVIREGTGMIDLMGDTRAVQESVQNEDYAQYVKDNTDLQADFNRRRQAGEDITIEEYGRDHYEAYGQDEGRDLPMGEYSLQDAGRQAGFDKDNKFMGLSALAEDIGRGGQQRAREADIADVERLGGRATDAYRAQGDLSGALAEARAIGAGGSEDLSAIPANPLFGTSAQGTLAERTALENANISAITGGRTGDYDPRMEQGLQAGFQGPVQPGQQTQQYAQPGGTDAFRSALMQQGMGALDQGLSARENRAIQEAARARSTNMGRTFDQTASIKEAEAVIAEDNARRQQNRAFAQSALGQEVGIQQADMARGLQAQQLELGRQSAGVDRLLTAEEKDIERAMRRDAMQEQYRQQGLGAERANAAQMVGLEQATSADPFQAILQRQGQNNLGAGGALFGQAGYGLDSGPQYLNPEAGLGFIQNQATNAANMYGAQIGADATKQAGLYNMIGSIGGAATGAAIGKCWVAREVYGEHNPAWLLFRNWLDTDAPRWFDKLYLAFGERFANFISNKPRLKARIRLWMDTKIGR